jgi:hypothetical protein
VGRAAEIGDGAEGRPLASLGSELTGSQRRARATTIRDAAARRGITNAVLLGGIADAETGMAMCWSEATWACRGPTSPDCGGGPVIAGSGDGPCSHRQGGLGMFQFDAGTYDQTIAREGERVLRTAGNVDAAVDFVLAMVIRSAYVDGVSTEAEAKAWINGARIGTAAYATWIKTVTAYYNGCVPGRCSVYASRYARYDQHTRDVATELGASFWSAGASPAPEPAPAPAPAPAGASCTHSLGGAYGSGACSASYQCCDGAWRTRTSGCGACACVESTGRTGCAPAAPEPVLPPPPPAGASCTHSLGGPYGSGACSASYQCCDGAWRLRGSGCGACACTEATGRTGC